MIRRTTFTTEEMNPPGYIPFLNGCLNIKTGKLEQFSPDLFYTYQINANLLDRYVTLADTPLFSYVINTLFPPKYIPMVLSYSAYAFYPSLPVHKALFIVGQRRIGKGTFTSIISNLFTNGAGSFSLSRLLTADRFMFQGLTDKNLIVDNEASKKNHSTSRSRSFTKRTRPDRNFTHPGALRIGK